MAGSCPARYRMSWRERGGPPAARPARLGFGHIVIGRLVEHALDAAVSLEYPSAGFEWQMSAPAAMVVDAENQ